MTTTEWTEGAKIYYVKMNGKFVISLRLWATDEDDAKKICLDEFGGLTGFDGEDLDIDVYDPPIGFELFFDNVIAELECGPGDEEE
jgi:hypothetical protein